MEYYDFINTVPNDTKKIIKNAIKIYKNIEKETIYCNYYNAMKMNNHKEMVNREDKIYVSIFLSSLMVESDVKRILNNNNITFENVSECLDIDGVSLDDLSEAEFKNYYENEFKDIIDTMQLAFRDKEISRLYPEKLILPLCYETKIIDGICSELGLLNLLQFSFCYTNAFYELQDSLFKKLDISSFKEEEEEENIEKQDTSSNSGSFISLLESLLGVNGVSNSESRSFSNVDKYGEYLTDKEYLTNPAIGRDKEIKSIELSLLSDKSAILVGEPGVGKTAVVEGLAYQIQNKQVPKKFENSKILKINTSALVSGCKFVGMFEERVEKLLKELVEQKDVILFIDELHTALGAGAGSNSHNDLANILKPYLDRGQIKMIGATTKDEYDEYISEDAAFRRRFERIDIKEPENKITTQILKGTIPTFEKITDVKFEFNENLSDKILNFLVNTTHDKSRVYNDKSSNPDLALSILRKAFAYAALYEHETLQIEDIKEAILECDRLYKVTREKRSRELLDIFSNNDIQKTKSKIINISDYI